MLLARFVTGVVHIRDAMALLPNTLAGTGRVEQPSERVPNIHWKIQPVSLTWKCSGLCNLPEYSVNERANVS